VRALETKEKCPLSTPIEEKRIDGITPGYPLNSATTQNIQVKEQGWKSKECGGPCKVRSGFYRRVSRH